MRIRLIKTFLWFIVGVGAAVALSRFINGLGAVTNLSDKTPWGLWIGFDVMGGVALAAGGFVLTAIVYIFHLERYHGIVRSAVLTAFLGYVAVAVGLLFDIGIPYNIWRPMFWWNPHSALFEVAWCVMLYLTVLALEFSRVVLEKSPFKRLYHIMRKLTIPLVLLGIMLSTLHQSSLGTLFILTPHRLHPLWYTPLLPLHFFISAIALGLGMVSLEGMVSHWAYNRPIRWDLLRGLAKYAGIVLVVYIALKFIDLARLGNLHYLLVPSLEAVFFYLEIALSAIIPAILFLFPRLRKTRAAIAVGASMIVFGFVFNRILVGGLGHVSQTGARYFPSLAEFLVSISIVSVMALVFFFFVENFRVFEHDPVDKRSFKAQIKPIEPDPVTQVRLGSIIPGSAKIYSIAAVVGVALGISFMPLHAQKGARLAKTPVKAPRTIKARFEPNDNGTGKELLEIIEPSTHPGDEPYSQVLVIDGNDEHYLALFDHKAHEDLLKTQGKDCDYCHHLNKPYDTATGCFECHRDMYAPSNIFSHRYHQQALGGNDGCTRCHQNTSEPKTFQTATACSECHKAMVSQDSIIPPPELGNRVRLAPGYMNAMHGLCIECHKVWEQRLPEWEGNLQLCSTCHRGYRDMLEEVWNLELER